MQDKDESSKETEEGAEEAAVEVKENGVPEEAPASEETPEATTPKGEDAAEPKKKKKDKKKKWSFRSISFSRKDKSKPSKEGGAEKNGDVAELAEEVSDASSACNLAGFVVHHAGLGRAY